MSSDRATLMLKYQKAKVKLLEYDVPKENYPSFPLDYNDLSFPTIYVLSLYANSLIEDDEENRKNIESILDFVLNIMMQHLSQENKNTIILIFF